MEDNCIKPVEILDKEPEILDVTVNEEELEIEEITKKIVEYKDPG